MTVKIGLISDVHATPAPLLAALEIFQRQEVDMILCAGDIAGYGRELEQTVALLIESNCRTIMGNHDLWQLSRSDADVEGMAEQYLRTLPTMVELVVEEKNIYMVHASPPDSLMEGITLLDEKGEMLQEQKEFWSDALKEFSFDVLVVGHTHQVFAEQLGQVLVVNPGSCKFNHTCAILSLPEMQVEIMPLGGKSAVPSLSWAKGGPIYQ